MNKYASSLSLHLALTLKFRLTFAVIVGWGGAVLGKHYPTLQQLTIKMEDRQAWTGEKNDGVCELPVALRGL